MSSFVPLDDLADKNDQQRQEYYLAACDFLQVPPELNLLKYFFTGEAPKRKLILYATRGATDLIRERMRISTVSLTQHDGPGYVSFTATGKDPNGRLEMATGVASTEGLKGDALGVAITIAQTKASRRMTLQFAGGGFLDETELPTGITPVEPLPPGVSLAQLFTPAPSVAPNSAPGKDVTTEQILTATAIPGLGPLVPDLKADYVKDKEQQEFSDRMEKLRREAISSLSTQNPPKEGVSLQTIVSPNAETPQTSEIKPKRTRRSRNTVSLDSPGQPVQTVIPPGNIDANGVITPVETPAEKTFAADVKLNAAVAESMKTAPQPVQVVAVPAQAVAAAPAQADSAPVVLIQIPSAAPIEALDLPSADQLKEYRVRLAKYANDILPNGGMIPTEGIGGVTMKLRKFAGLQLGETKDVMKFSTDQWTELLDFLDSYTESNGAAKLVAYIDKVVGVK